MTNTQTSEWDRYWARADAARPTRRPTAHPTTRWARIFRAITGMNWS